MEIYYHNEYCPECGEVIISVPRTYLTEDENVTALNPCLRCRMEKTETASGCFLAGLWLLLGCGVGH